MPKPSWIPSVICFVPQNGRFVKVPEVAVSWASVGHFTAPVRAHDVVAARATTSSASAGIKTRLRLVGMDFRDIRATSWTPLEGGVARLVAGVRRGRRLARDGVI